MPRKEVKSSFINLLLFSGNEVATTASFNLISVFFMLMITDNLVLSAVVAGLIFTFSRLFDAVTDPLIGTFIDRTLTRFGRYRPFIVGGSFIINLGILMLFGGFVHFQSDTLMYLWIILWYIIYIIGYTAQSACTRSAQTLLTNDKIQRPLLGGLLAGFSYLFYGLFLVYSIEYVISFPGGTTNPLGYRNLAFLVVFVNIFFTILAVIGLRKSDCKECFIGLSNPKKVTLNSMVKLVKNNVPLRALIVAAGTNKLAQLITGTSMVYFFTYTVGNIGLQKVVASYGLIFGVVGALLGMIFAQLFDRKKSFLIGTYLGLLFPVLIVITHPFTENLQWLLTGLLVGIVFATAIASTNVLPLIADTADYEYFVNKQYIPSVVGTTFSLIDKMMSSLSGVILGFVLGIINYEENMAPTTDAFWAFYAMVIILPALGHVASLIAFKYYPITKEYYNKMIMLEE